MIVRPGSRSACMQVENIALHHRDSRLRPLLMSLADDSDSYGASQAYESSQVLQTPDMSVLERMKRRLGLLDDTQVIENTPSDALMETQKISEPVLLTQLPVDDAEIAEPAEEIENTQKVTPMDEIETTTIDESTQKVNHVEDDNNAGSELDIHNSPKIPPQPSQLTQNIPLLSPKLPPGSQLEFVDRESKIEELARKKQQQRQAAQLEADISRTSLTDDENDLHEETFGAIPVQQLEETEQFLSVQKRERNIEPHFDRKIIHSKQKLLAAFDNDDLDTEAPAVPSLTPPAKSSPLTSPMQKNDESDEELNVLDLIGQPTTAKPVAIKKKSPIEVYAAKLKDQAPETAEINLDSDSDSQQAIPPLSKQDKLAIKQRFSRKKLGKKSNIALALPAHLRSLLLAYKENRTEPNRARLISKLKRANINQLQVLKEENGDDELYEELQKDEEVMGSLLEREMERARNIRKKEKLREKQKKADQDYMDAIPESDGEIPDSEVNDSENVDDENESDGSDIAIERRKRVVLLSDNSSDEEDEVEEEKGESNEKPTFDLAAIRVDDSYMFGAVENEEHAMEDFITTSSQRAPVKNSPNRTRRFSVAELELFKNLKRSTPEFTPGQILESQNAEEDEEYGQVPSFLDLETQADKASTQTHEAIATQADTNDDDVTPATLNMARKLIRKNDPSQIIDEEDDKENEAADLQEQIKLYERKLRMKEVQNRRKRHVMAQKGLNKIIEGEAEESEDEWHGLGGKDGEFSDVANSDDEKMIDNSFNFDLNDAEVKKKFMEQYQIKDQKELEKLLDDIKNHRLAKRVRPNGLDIELSDEEDEILAAYRRQKLNEQRQRALQNKEAQNISKTEKAKAFFASMEEDSQSIIRIDDEEDHEQEVQVENEEKDEDNNGDLEADQKKGRVIRIDEAFVQRQLSFLTSTSTDAYFEEQRISRLQHGFGSEDEHEELHELRKDINLMSRSHAEIVTEAPKKHGASDTDDDDIMPAFKRPSLVQSFRSTSNSGSEGSFSGVTISKQYKAATGGKGSISSMSRANRKVKSIKEQKLERRLNHVSQTKTKIFSGSGFD